MALLLGVLLVVLVVVEVGDSLVDVSVVEMDGKKDLWMETVAVGY